MAGEPLIAFIHLQRTGGSTIDRALRAAFGPAYARVGTFADYDATLARVREIGEAPGEVRIVRGHMTAGVRRWLPEGTRLFTMLREPTARVVSHYHHLSERKKPNRPFGLPPMPESMTLEECVAEGAYILDNLMTRLLSDAVSPLESAGAAQLEQAKRNVEQTFAAVGIAERYDESLVLIEARLGLPRLTYRRVGTSSGPRPAELPPETIALIESKNELDAELYAFAAAQFAAQVAELEDDLDFRVDRAALQASQKLLAGDSPQIDLEDPVERRLALARGEALARGLELYEAGRKLRKLDMRYKQLERANRRLRRAAAARVGLPRRIARALRRRLGAA